MLLSTVPRAINHVKQVRRTKEDLNEQGYIKNAKRVRDIFTDKYLDQLISRKQAITKD